MWKYLLLSWLHFPSSLFWLKITPRGLKSEEAPTGMSQHLDHSVKHHAATMIGEVFESC